ncbi:hypothetical protein [Streptomyces sp. NPDC051662]|uniref:DUF6924 domain-containing protein n=1 Tax=Streptomyces sp. NPDC051662 TaxID=3154750 RepID=UPI00341247C7
MSDRMEWLAGRDRDAALIIRTDYSDEQAVAVLAREECDSDEEFEADGGEFRTVPAGVHEMHANLMIANLSFGDFKEAAEEDPQGTFQGFAT